MVQLQLSSDQATALREVLENKLLDLAKEINRTDNLEFKDSLKATERLLDHLLRQLPSGDEAAG